MEGSLEGGGQGGGVRGHKLIVVFSFMYLEAQHSST